MNRFRGRAGTPFGKEYFALVVLIIGATVVLDFFIQGNFNQRHHQTMELHLVHQMSTIRARLERDINSSLFLIHGVEVNISMNPDITREEFKVLARTMMHHPNILNNMAAAPDFVIRYMYPEEGNEAAIGLNYRDIPSQWAPALKARVSCELVLAGPTELVQGGLGLIGRAPVFVDTPEGSRFWGLVSAIIDIDRLYERAGLGNEFVGLRIAIRGRDGLGEKGEVFYGPADLFDSGSEAVFMPITLSSGSFQMAAVPVGGWSRKHPHTWPIRISVVVAACLLLLFITNRRKEEARRREAEEALRESEKRFRDLTMVSADWIWEIDADRRYTYASGRVEEIMGYTVEEMIGKSPFDMITEEDAGAALRSFEKIVETQAPIDDLENWHRARDGGLVCLLTNGLPVLDDNGRFNGYRGVNKDITQRKKTEMELVKARRHVFEILESTTDAFFEVDAEFNLTYINRRAEESIGLSKSRHLGLKLWDILPQDVGTRFYDEYHRAMKDQTVVSLEAFYPPLERWHQIYVYPTPNSLSVYLHDVTEQKRVQLERESIFQLSLDMIAVAGFDGYFKDINPSWERILGWNSEELLSRPWLDYIHPDDVQSTIDVNKGLVDGQSVISFENRYRCKDGSYRWISWNSFPDPVRRLIYAVARDATETIQAREILQHDRDRLEARVNERTAALAEVNRDLTRAKEKAEAANHAKTDFLANISHELRTPLNPIIGLTDYLQETNLNGEQRQFVIDIRESAERLLKIINNLIELTRIDSRGLVLDMQPFDLELTIDRLAREIRPAAEARGLAVEARLGEGAPKYIESDPRYMHKVLGLLMENALKFTERGRITLLADIDNDETGWKALHFTVIDTGVGISADKLGLLFEDLTQADGSLTRKFGGLGLGLTLARRIVSQMNGRIWAESRENSGSSFHVVLPYGECCHWE